MAVAAIIPFADMTIVLTHGGSVGTALGIHGLTAVLVVIVAVRLLREPTVAAKAAEAANPKADKSLPVN
jgi:hypothetical protein